MKRNDIEEIILGMADVVTENRILKQQIKDLELECRKYRAMSEKNYDEVERLCDLSVYNSQVKVASLNGVYIGELIYD